MRTYREIRSTGRVLLVGVGCLLALSGCGGGGGGQKVAVKGKVLRVETNTRPDPVATVALGGASGQSDSTTGSFLLPSVGVDVAVPLTITAQGAQTYTTTIALDGTQATNDLGTLFITDNVDGYTANVSGRVILVVNNQNQPVTGATIIFGGHKTTTLANGTFRITGLPVDLGFANGAELGTVTAGALKKTITSETVRFPLVKGENNLEDWVVANPVGGTPLPPYTIKGVVTVNGQKPTAAVSINLVSNGNNLGTITADQNGNYFFWVVPGTYTITASQAGLISQHEDVTLAKLDTPITAPTLNLTP